jgi:hypothetical protein
VSGFLIARGEVRKECKYLSSSCEQRQLIFFSETSDVVGQTLWVTFYRGVVMVGSVGRITAVQLELCSAESVVCGSF